MPRPTVEGQDVGSRRTTQKGYKDYYKKRAAESGGGIFPRGLHSRTSQIITSFTDEHYLHIVLRSLDDGTANSLTAFKNAMTACVDQGHRSGNMKDVATGEETAFQNLCGASFCLMMDMALQLQIKEMLAYPAESDTNALAVNRPVVITTSSFDKVTNELEQRGAVIPNAVIALVKEFNFYFKIQEPYVKGVVNLPGSYLIPFAPSKILTELEVYKTAIMANQLLAVNYMNKFGVKFSSFNRSMIEGAQEFTLNSPRALQYFGHTQLHYYDAAAIVPLVPTGDIEAADGVATRKYWFVKDPNEDLFHALVPFLYGYVVTDNQYGGIFDEYTCDASDNRIGVPSCEKTNSTTWNNQMIYDPEEVQIAMLWYGAWTQTNTFNVSLTGTSLAAETDIINWPLAFINNAKYATLIHSDEMKDGVLIGYLDKHMFGG